MNEYGRKRKTHRGSIILVAICYAKLVFPDWKLMPAVLFSAGDIWNYCRRKRLLRAA